MNKNRLAYSHGRPKSTTTPYVYLIIHKTSGKRYYGVRFSSDCDPSDLWVTYFSSSKIIHQLIDVYGKDDFIYEVRKTFNNKDEALTHEFKVLRRMQLHKHKNYLNRNISTGFNGTFKKGEAISISNKELDKVLRWPVDKDIPLGWFKGNIHSNIISKSKGRKWYHDPITEETRMFKKTDSVPTHYIEGRPANHYDSISKLRKENKRVWITNGSESKLIQINSSIPEGWSLGKFASKDFKDKISKINKILRKFITDGNINKKILMKECVPEGWRLGRTISEEYRNMIIKRNKSRAKSK